VSGRSTGFLVCHSETVLSAHNDPRESAFLRYRRARGRKSKALSDFFIAAHAAVARCALLTRDIARYRAYFPTVELIAP